MRALRLLVVSVAAALPAQAALKVITTTQDAAALTRAVGMDRVDVKALARGYQDPHFLEAKPTSMVALNRADLVVSIGLDLEIGYLPALINGAHNDRLQAGSPGSLDLSQAIAPLEVIAVADRSQGDIHPNGNPHYWLDPENGRLMARAIAGRLTQLDPEGKAAYAANLAAFEKTLTEKEAAWAKAMAPLAGQPIVTFHKSWSYFVKTYKLDVVGFVEPKPGIPPTPLHTLELIRLCQAKNVKVVMVEVFYDARPAQLIASKTSAKVAVVPNSVLGVDEAKTYFELFDVIVAAVVKAYGA